MDGIIGQWSTSSWFYDDPADEILVFLPDGKGVFEYHWWKLSHYETFTYQVDAETLSVIGDKNFSYDDDQNAVKESTSTFRFNGKFLIRKANSEEINSGCKIILELDEPLQKEYPATNKFGQGNTQNNVSDYKLSAN
ncbi:MAG: hypothetical protein H7Y59_05170 [Anaerolineales bacterium]|nr:hypothetical protein [Anaerolineales bacterium]